LSKEHIERCERICGQDKDLCFIHNRNQVHCIADIVVNKAMGVKGMIARAKGQEGGSELLDATLAQATDGIQALMDWVKYLRVVEYLRDLRFYEAEVDDRRRDDRYCLPDIYQEHIRLELRNSGGTVAVKVLDFSRHGLRFQGAGAVEPKTVLDCRLSTTGEPGDYIYFKVRVAHCLPVGDKCMVGAEILEKGGEENCLVYRQLYNLILEMAVSRGERPVKRARHV
jgi:hypothetical protein